MKSYYSQGLLEELCEENRKKLEQEPQNHMLRCSLANALLQLGQYDAAIDEYQKCIEQNPCPEYYINFGKALLNAGDYKRAIKAFEEVLKRNRKWPDAYYQMAIAYRSLGQLEKADDNLNKAILINPKYREAINERAHILEATGHLEEALKEYKKVIALFFSEFQFQDADAYNYELSVLFDCDDLIEESIRQLKQFVRKYPGFADGYYKLGQALEAKGMKNEAMMAFRRALEINPNYETARKCFWKR